MATTKVTTGGITDATIATADIADQAVTLAKLPHGTSSNDGKFLRANNGADPTFETVTGTTINNNADNRVITGSGTANTLNGESNLFFDGSQLGVGTTSPYQYSIAHFESTNGITLAGSSQSRLLFRHTGGGTDLKMMDIQSSNGIMKFRKLADNTTATDRMIIDASGKVGIGTSSPDQTLHVYKGSAGSVDSTSSSVLTLENSNHVTLQFLSPNNTSAQVRFGDPQDTGAGYIDYNHSNNALTFGTNGPEKMRLDASGNVGIATNSPTDKLHVNGTTNFVSNSYIGGDLYMYGNSYGNGIFLGGSGSANKLDDYEEGAWTITIQVDSYNFNGTYSQQAGRYVKIGSMVHCVGYLQLTNKGNDNGTVSIGGLPFTTSSGGNGTRGSGVVGYYQGVNSSVDKPMVILVEQNDTKITMRHSQSTGSGGLSASDIDNSFGMFFNVTYLVA